MKYYFKFLEEKDLSKYLIDDYVFDLVLPESNNEKEAQSFGCNSWLLNSNSKRLIFSELYGDLLQNEDLHPLNILDVGAGMNLAQKKIAKRHNYTILDLLAHDNLQRASSFCEREKINLIVGDWFDILDKQGEYDLIICNDLFPNVDQRLPEFLSLAKKKWPKSSFRMSMTYYPSLRFYNVKRTDADELMCLRAWDGEDCLRALQKGYIQISKSYREKFINFNKSIFPNGRCVVIFKTEE